MARDTEHSAFKTPSKNRDPPLARPPETPTPTKRRRRKTPEGHVPQPRPATTATPRSATGATSTPTPQRYSLRRTRRDSQGSPLASPPSRRTRRALRHGGTTTTTTTNSTSSTPVRPRPRARYRPLLHPDRNTSGSRLSSTTMATAGKWREEQILIICPGSRTTMAQLGCNELTPPMHRFPTRMFKDGDEWRPYHTFKRTRVVDGADVDEWVEDVDSDDGAVYPIEGGRIAHMEAFLAFLDHVHAMLTTTYHNTPIMLMVSPQWTRPDCETIAQYIFEKTRTPALCMIHSGIATQYGLKWPNMTVIDIGYEKVDVTAIHDGRVVNHMDLGSPSPAKHISGGEVFTQALLKKLGALGFTHDMAEQLKKSPICEVLPYAAGQRDLMELPQVVTAGVPLAAPPSPELTKATEAMDEEDGVGNGEDEGVLDVATIVTSGQTKEFLAKKEREKEKARLGKKAAKDAKDAEAGAARLARLPNSKRTHNTFFFEEVVQEDVPPEPKEAATNGASIESLFKEPEVKEAEAKVETNGTGPPAEGAAVNEAPKPETATDAPESAPAAAPEPAPVPAVESAVEPVAAPPAVTEEAPKPEPTNSNDTPERRAKRIRRDIEVGPERFSVAQRGEIDRIVGTIYRTIQGIDDMYMRPACWDNLVFVGNGARLRGLRENILQTLNARHLVSPSTATMFTSELPSNMATPTGTGSQTPTGSYSGAPHQLAPSGVNPLLQAATTASTFGVGAAVGTPQAGSEAGGPVAHHFHSQTPTSIKTATLPTYLGEWSKNGFEEAMFLGSLVAARIAFSLHSNMDAQSVEAQRLMSLSRVDYNELGPKGIRTHSMLS